MFEVLLDNRVPKSAIADDNPISKRHWAIALNVNRKSIQRWERLIIRESAIADDYSSVRSLDSYKRCILLLVALHKRGLVDGRRRTNQSIQDWLAESKITRQQFNYWRKANGAN